MDDLTDDFVNQMHFQSGVVAEFVAISIGHYCPQYNNLTFQRYH